MHIRTTIVAVVASLSVIISGTEALGTDWTGLTEFNAPSGAMNFGTSVALDGDTCVIGAYGTDSYVGSAYVYTQDAAGFWGTGTVLTVPSGASSFGISAALDGDTCVIGAFGNNSNPGSAYVYTQDAAGNWSTGTALTVPSGASSFGGSVALDGDTCVIGANRTNSNAGSAYVYTRDAAGNWSTGTALTAPSEAMNFGGSVALDGTTCLIGANGTDSGTGSVHVYTQDAAGNWSPGTALAVPSGTIFFGGSVALDGTTCLIGAENNNYYSVGSAYIYTQDAAGNWSMGTALTVPSGAMNFGGSVALDGDTCVVGAYGTDSYVGSAYAYTQDAAGNWSTGTALAVPSGASYFGNSVATDGEICVIGNYFSDNSTGSVYLYASNATTGACCATSGCSIVTEDQCAQFGGTWTEDGSCDDCPASCAGDTNGDGVIDIFDLLNMLSDWGTCP